MIVRFSDVCEKQRAKQCNCSCDSETVESAVNGILFIYRYLICDHKFVITK